MIKAYDCVLYTYNNKQTQKGSFMSALRESEIGFGGSSEESSPTITLRRGKTELKVSNAAAVIKKINEMYPGDNSYYSWNPKKSLTDIEQKRQRKWMEAARSWFKAEMFGGLDDFEVIVNETPTPSSLVSREETLTQTEAKPVAPTKEFIHDTFYNMEDKKQAPLESPVIHSVNKNAYEIRTDVLQMACDWVRWQTETLREMGGKPEAFDDDSVLETASKFYRFVENRR